MIVVELTAAIDAAGTEKTFYVADAKLTTEATDTPPNESFGEGVMDGGKIGLYAYSDGRTGGATRLDVGEIVIANADGSHDDWINYSFDGRPVVIRQGKGGAYPADYTVLLAGTAEGVEATGNRIVVRLRDKQYLFDLPVCTAVYAGDNVLPGGLEGRPDDIKGAKKPRGWGTVFNIKPPCVNTSRLIYEVGACVTVDAVYEGGNALVKGPDYVSQGDMETNVPAAGNFRCWPAGGCYRVATTPSAECTADVTFHSAVNSTCAQIVKALALAAGVPDGDISAADVAALDAACGYVLGIWLNDDTSYRAALDTIATSIGAWYGFDDAGVLRLGRLTAPSGDPAVTITPDMVKRIERRPSRDAGGIPVWRVTVRYARNYTVQESGLVGVVTAARRAWLAEEMRQAVAEDAAVKDQWLLAGEMTVDTVLTSEADAQAEAARLLALYKVRRDLFDFDLPVGEIGAPDMIAVARAVYPRYGMAAGRDFRIIGRGLELGRNRVTLTVWG